MQFVFADYTLDISRRELWHGSSPVQVEPQVFDLLVYLIRNADRVVSRDDLISSVWGGRIVSDSTLTSRINAARRATGDSGGEQKVIRTVARKGFRFIAAVREQNTPADRGSGSGLLGSDGHTSHANPLSPAQIEPLDTLILPGPRRGSIAVMPFTEVPGDATSRGGLGNGLATDIITRLAKLRSLFV